jgi:four helix bundle protein
MQDFRKLLVWQKAQTLIVVSHEIAAKIRGAHYASLRGQIIRASMSISANIAEGRAQRSDREFARFLQYSLASANELESHILTCRNLNLISQKDSDRAVSLAIEIRRMLHGITRKLTAGSRPQ